MARGSAPGEHRGGRKAGTPNKVGADARAAAAEHGPQAIEVLAAIMSNDEAPASARISAAVAILDRAYGKPGQQVDVTSRAETHDDRVLRVSWMEAELASKAASSIVDGSGADELH